MCNATRKEKIGRGRGAKIKAGKALPCSRRVSKKTLENWLKLQGARYKLDPGMKRKKR